MVSAMNQPQVDIHPLPFKTPSHLPLHPTPLGCHRAPGLGSLHHTGNFHQLSVLHMVMYMFQCYSLNSSHPLLLQLSSQVLPLHLCICFCSSNIHQYHFTRFHVYAFIYYIYFSLSDLLHSVSQFLGSSTSVKLTRIVPFRGWVIFHCVYVPRLLYTLFSW